MKSPGSVCSSPALQLLYLGNWALQFIDGFSAILFEVGVSDVLHSGGLQTKWIQSKPPQAAS